MIYILMVFVAFTTGELAHMDPQVFTDEAACQAELKKTNAKLVGHNKEPGMPTAAYFGAACVPVNQKVKAGTEI